jgi:hypothetical protein
MERLFLPGTRYRDLRESQVRQHFPELLQDLNLKVSTEELLSAERAYTYADLYAMLGNGDTILWLASHAAVALTDSCGRIGECSSVFSLGFSADGKDIVAFARSPEHLLEICDIVLRLLAASVVQSIIIQNIYSTGYASINAPTLAYLMEQCQSLKVLSLNYLEMDEEHCRVLGSYSRPGLKIELIRCKLKRAGASALVEILGRNQGPTKLECCDIDNSVLANGLRGNSRLKSLKPRRNSGSGEACNREILAIAGALKENKGLVDLDFSCSRSVNDETWGAICDSLETHLTLEVLDLRVICCRSLPAVLLKSRVQALLDMMKMNMSIHTIRLYSYLNEHELFRGSVVPYLDANRLRPRVRAIQKALPSAYRVKVLGQALLAVRTDPSRFWMLLSGNAEVAFPSRTTTAASLNVC